MDVLTERRKHVALNISHNPVAITIKRTVKVASGGGFAETVTTHGPYTVRIFQQKSSTPQYVSTLAGIKQVDKSWGMLADYTADIKAEPTIKDEFSAPGLGHFIVKGVYPQSIAGQIAGFQADLEKVD